MGKKYPERLFAAMLGMAFSANLIATAGAVDVKSPLPAAPVSVATELDPGTSAPETTTGSDTTTPPSTGEQQQSGEPSAPDKQEPSSTPGAPDAPKGPQDTQDSTDTQGSQQNDDPAAPQAPVDTGDFKVEKVEGDERGDDFKFKDGCLTFLHGGNYVVSMKAPGTETQHQIAVDKDFVGSITIDGLLITVEEKDYGQGNERPAIKVDGSAKLNLYLKGHNVLKGGWDAAAVQFQNVHENAYLIIAAASGDADAYLEVHGGKGYQGASAVQVGGAGIGGQYLGSTSNITIRSGTIVAKGASSCAGIGSGEGSNAKNITIEGGNVTAVGGEFGGAGIGGAASGVGENIVISGGIVNAKGTSGAGIGSGYQARNANSKIRITGGRVIAESTKGDAIGGGLDNPASSQTKITIGKASVKASSEEGKPFSATPKNEAGKDLHLLHLKNFNSLDAVKVDGQPCSQTIPAFDLSAQPAPEQELYLYLAEGQRVSYNGGHYLTKLVNDKLTLTPEQSGGGSSGSGSFGGGSSSGNKPVPKPQITHNPDGSTTEITKKPDGTIVETTKRPDGSKTTVETKKDKTVTKTDWDKQGNMVETVAKPDGSSVTTERRKDGTKVATRADRKGYVSAEVKVPAKDKNVTVMIPTPKRPAPGDVIVIVNPDGTETVAAKTIPDKNGLVFSTQKDVNVKVESRGKTFADVPAGHWAGRAVDFVTARSLFNGINKTTFAPDLGMTRGMLAVVLHNLESNPAADLSSSFTDVAENAWYEGAVQWAVQQDIVSGYGNGLFGADDQITREQLAVMLYRYSGSPSVSTQSLNFTDADQVSDYADRAMYWAVDQRIISGVGNGSLDPKGTATRAQVAVMLTRLMESGAKGNQ